jgi:carboxyl-terminal processing protease
MHSQFWTSPVWETPFENDLSENQKIAGLSKFWAEAKYNFAFFEQVPDLDWDQTYLEYLERVRQTSSTLEYYQLLQRLCARLNDGHTAVFPPAELADRLFARPLLRTELVENKVIVTRVDDDGLRQQGILPGLEIVAIEDTDVHTYADEHIAPYQSYSTPQDRDVRTYSYGLLCGPVGQPVKLTFRDAAGQLFRRLLAREDWRIDTSQTPLIDFRWLEGAVAYVALNSFNDPDLGRRFAEMADDIRQADALILDLRDNGGGNSDHGYAILAHLTTAPFKTSAWRTREYRPAFRAWGQPDRWYEEAAGEWPAKETDIFTGPVAVLTGPRTYSAAEDFCVAFAAMGRGKIIGEPTGGSTGQPLMFSLPGGGTGAICTKWDTFPDGTPLVGKGVQPHIEVRPTIKDIRAGRDTVLEAATQLVSSTVLR